MALPKSNRLSLRTSKDLFLNAKRLNTPFFSLSFVPSQNTNSPQFAVVVSKKVSRKAHDRHKIRRLTSSAVFEKLSNFPVGYYLVFPKSSILITPFVDLLSDLSTITAKLK